VGSGALRSKTPMLSKAEKAALEEIPAEAVLAIHHQLKVQRQFGKRALEEFQVGPAAQRLLRPVQEDRGPRVHGRVDIAEVPLISRDLPCRMQEVLCSIRSSCSFAKSTSTVASAMV